MPFTSETAKLHRGPGGRKRKTHPDVVARKAASEIAREYLETHADPVLDTYLKLAKGWTEKRISLNGKEFEIFKYDSKTTCHYIDKILPDLDGEASQAGDTYIQFNFGVPAGSAPSPGLHNGNGPGLNGGTLHLGSDESGSE